MGECFGFASIWRGSGSRVRLFIPLQFTDQSLTDATNELLARNDLRDARLRLTVTRGMASDDALHGMRLEPTAFLTATTFESYPAEYYQRGMTVILLDEQKLNPYDVQAGHKTLNYFSRLRALRAANERRAGEALWFNVHNYLQSGSISNVVCREGWDVDHTTHAARDAGGGDSRFNAVSEEQRATRRDARGGDGVRGEMRIDVKLAAIDVNQLLDADELFITNSIMGVMPICRIERKVIGNDRPGQITTRLMQSYQPLTDSVNASYKPPARPPQHHRSKRRRRSGGHEQRPHPAGPIKLPVAIQTHPAIPDASCARIGMPLDDELKLLARLGQNPHLARRGGCEPAPCAARNSSSTGASRLSWNRRVGLTEDSGTSLLPVRISSLGVFIHEKDRAQVDLPDDQAEHHRPAVSVAIHQAGIASPARSRWSSREVTLATTTNPSACIRQIKSPSFGRNVIGRFSNVVGTERGLGSRMR